jgi:WD40 repeat protein
VPGWLVSVGFARDGAIVGRGVDSAVRVWDARSGAITDTFAAGAGLNLALADGRTVVAGAQDGTITAWDVDGARRLGSTFRWRSPDAGCLTEPCIVIDRRGTLMAESSGNGTVGLVDLRTERPAGTLPPKTGPLVDALAFLPDGRTLVTGGVNGKAVLWDMRTRAAVRTLRLGGHVWWAAASPDGKLLALQTQGQGQSSSRVDVREVPSGRLAYRRNVSNGKGGLEFSRDGRMLAALGCCEPGSTIEVWSARSGKELFSPRVAGHATSIAFSPDSHLLAAGTEDGKVVLWDLAAGSPAGAPVDVATGPVEAISFSPDGRLFVASSDDGRATLWNPRTHKRLADAFPEEENSVPVARFTSRGDVVIENVRNTSRWPIDPQSWARFACRVAGRDLTRDEWTDLLPGRPYRSVCRSL